MSRTLAEDFLGRPQDLCECSPPALSVAQSRHDPSLGNQLRDLEWPWAAPTDSRCPQVAAEVPTWWPTKLVPQEL